MADLIVSETESVTSKEALGFTWESNLLTAEVVGWLDLPGRMVELRVAQADVSATADGIAGTIANNLAASDATSTAEVRTLKVSDPNLLTADTTTTSELIQLLLLSPFWLAAQEATATTEQLGLFTSIAITVAEKTATGESILGSPQDYVNVVGDLTSLSEATAFTYVNRTVDVETVGWLDQPTVAALLAGIGVRDTTTVSDAVTVSVFSNLNPLDTTSTADMASAAMITSIADIESTTITEARSLLLSVTVSTIDATSVSELIRLAFDSRVVDADQLGSSEFISLGFSTGHNGAISERVATTDKPKVAIVYRWLHEEPGGVAPTQRGGQVDTSLVTA